MELIESDVARVAAPAGAGAAAAEAVTAFTADLYSALAGPVGNLVCSPYSVAVALGMTVQGARGRTAREMLEVLHSPDAAALASGLNAIDAELATRRGPVTAPGDEPQRLELATANSLWGQRDVAWRRAFLDVLAREFGAGLRAVDYRAAAEQARVEINAWVSDRTGTRIPELIPEGVVTEDTRLTLVNAIWLKAPWGAPFRADRTRPAPFHRLDGSTVEADLMRHDWVQAGYTAGDGWQAVDLAYRAGSLAMAVVVPDAGRFADVERSLGSWLPAILDGLPAARLELALPRWTSRTPVALREALSRLGMPTAFTERADLGGMGGDQPLKIDAVLHEAFVAVDEAGTEAAAATAATAVLLSFMPSPPPLVVDRPFLYVIHDLPTRTPLFVGRVLDPT
jgi:serpin B